VGRICRVVAYLGIVLPIVAAQPAWAIGKLKVEPAIGFGTSSLSMSVKTNGQDLQYTHTNSNFYFLNLAVEKVSMQIKFPIRDTQESRNTRGDTKVTDYQFGFGFKDHWQTDLYYQKYQGYFIQSKTAQLIQPDLSFSHVGGQMTYVMDPAYSLSMTRETGWQQVSTRGSWMASVGYDEFDLEGDLVPSSLNSGLRSSLQNAVAKSLSARVSRGHNWIWNKWFAGLLIGGGVNYNQIQYRYMETADSSSDLKIISNFGMSAGYRWTNSKVGIFVRASNWGLAFDDKELTSNTSSGGIYYSSYF